MVASTPVMDILNWMRGLEPDDWALSKHALIELDARLRHLQPRVVAELGSGASTVVLAKYAADTGATAVSYEHNSRYKVRTNALARRLGLNPVIVHAPLKYRDGIPSYDCVPIDDVEFLLIDGPPESTGGRADTFPAWVEHLAPDFEVWLDDGNRPGERAAVDDWKCQYPEFHFAPSPVERGIVRITPHPFAAFGGQDIPVNQMPDIDFSGVTVTILTGRRPELLADTLRHLPVSLFMTAPKIIICNNGGDDPTADIIESYMREWSNIETFASERFLPMGEVLAGFHERVDTELILPLEDDWRLATFDDTWLDRAREVLHDQPEVFQVRLRHASQWTRPRHMVTNRPIGWRPHRAGLIAAEAHFTSNPSLIRTRDWMRLWPTQNERTAMKAAHRAGLRTVVQMHPGAFIHTGEGNSLREITGG